MRLRQIIIAAMLLVAGNVLAQSDPQYVIKNGNNYLAHHHNGSSWVLQNATEFSPECLWYSGPNIRHNYYFYDGDQKLYLTAPLQTNGTLSLTPNPETIVLNNTSYNYYFYDWDNGGLARGVQHSLSDYPSGTCPDEYHSPGSECWEVVWVAYQNNQWKMSSTYSYGIVEGAALSYLVTVTEHPMDVQSSSGGLGDLTLTKPVMEEGENQLLSITISNYSYTGYPAYTTYVFDGTTHNYYEGSDHGTNTPGITSGTGTASTATYLWSFSGEGADYLSFEPDDNHPTSNLASPRLYYSGNYTGHKTATVTVTVTYVGGATQQRSATVTLKTPCMAPGQLNDPVVTYDGVTLSWYHTSDHYKVYWTTDENWVNNITSVDVYDVNTYTIPIAELQFNTTYHYKVTAFCTGGETDGTSYEFTTHKEADLLIYGAVFGGGRMADVTGNTEIVIVNCDSIGALYGGNDIAGVVGGTDGSKITIGVNANDPNSTYDDDYGVTSSRIKVGDVYGGGNGYYAYNGTSFEAASYNTTYDIPDGASILAMTQSHQVGNAVWTNETGSSQHYVCPTIAKSAITVSNDYVVIDSLFGGAKNAILNNTTNDVNITINGGTLFTVFGGNNFGGSLGYWSHENIVVNNTKTQSGDDYRLKQLGRDFGIGYLFGGGNKVQGQQVNIEMYGGQADSIFGGGNAADVRSTQLTIECEPGALVNGAYGNLFSDAITAYSSSEGFTINNNYLWDNTGIYNIRALFGGNNKASMETVPTLTLTSGSIGTVYGGGNAGDMIELATDDTNNPGNPLVINNNNVKYGTHVVMNSPKILIDYLYGGCQMSNVYYSTWVELKNGHVGTVYGGCNISGDVGSTRVNQNATPFIGGEGGSANPEYQKVFGGTYVVASGGTVYKNLFAGSNGLYHCKDNAGVYYVPGINYTNHSYVGLPVPTHNETSVVIQGVTVKGNVYAGGNLACVGFDNNYVTNNPLYPAAVGMASILMTSGTVHGDVYGGGNMANIYGSNEVQVSGGTILGALYGGNDRLGKVGPFSNRVLDVAYNVASDGHTPLTGDDKPSTYVGVTGNPNIHTIYGGGNGLYDYTVNPDIDYCDATDLPIQSSIFVDINIDGGDNGGHIDYVYGGGNGVSVQSDSFVKVFLNVDNVGANDGNHVGTIFGGNNMGHLDVLPDIILLHGNVGTVYGGCNEGAMFGNKTVAMGGESYQNIGSRVYLRDTYTVVNNGTTYTETADAKVTEAVYGGCRKNGVNNNSLVLVEGGNHSTAKIFGGSDISGDVGGTSRVIVKNNAILGDVFGGGNGNYDYTSGDYQGLSLPYSVNSRVDMLGGTADNLYAGGYAGPCGLTEMVVEGGTANNVFGGGNMAGTIKTSEVTTTTVNSQGTATVSTSTVNTTGNSTVTVNGGTVTNGVYGGCNASDAIAGDVNVIVHGGTLGTSSQAMTAGIYGGGYGKPTGTNGNVTVTIDKANSTATAPTIYADIYGGSALGQVNDPNATTPNLTLIDFKDGNLHGNIYGGGMGSTAIGDSAIVNGNVRVDLTAGTLFNNLYGGCNVRGGVTGNITVNLNGGTINGSAFGGGFGQQTATTSNVEVNFGSTPTSHNAYPKLLGDLYGGSGLGNVNTYNNNKTTVVNVVNGEITGSVYGGGLGQKDGVGGATSDILAKVNGKVYVNIGATDGATNPTYSGNAIINGSVYGCNNLNGSPQDSVFVNIYKTNHNTANAYPTNFPTSATQSEILTWLNGLPNTPANFALQAVYGGGNQAAYTPPYLNNKPRCTTVHVYDCQSNTIETLYGGGNAADVGYIVNGTTDTVHANTQMIVDGGRINRVFGGGNGYSSTGNHVDPTAANYNPGAFIFGTAYSHIHAGIINEVFGGANQYGGIDDIVLNLTGVGACTDQVYGSVFGCANEAPLNHSITTTIDCGVGTIGELYGGSNLAPIGIQGENNATVTLNLYGGTYSKVFGGSKGLAPNTTYPAGIPANIYGNVILNLYGGTIIDAFGGNDVNGSIGGTVTVNVLDYENDICPLNVTNIYGANNLAVYEPDDLPTGGKPTSPVVNVMHLKTSVGNNVYGGAYGASADVISNPQVNIGYDDSMANWIPDDHKYKNNTDALKAIVTNKVYGGGEMAEVVGTATVNIQKDNSQAKTLYGGGHKAGTTNTQVNILDGTVTTAVYGGCDEEGTITGNTEVNVLNDLGATGTGAYNVNVFGGGLGVATKTNGNVTVNIGGSNTSPVVYGTVYGGSAMGTVNDEATNDLTKVHLQSGTVNGNVFGGGLGDGSTPAYVKGNIQVIADGTTVNGNIFGANDQNGNPAGTVTVTVNSGTISQSVFGGGNVADFSGNAEVNITGGTITDCVYGGGNQADVGGTTVNVTGGDVTNDVFGGGYGAGTNVTGDVTVTIGAVNDNNDHTAKPTVRDVYGGSALGNVNTNASNTTTVNILNGTINRNVYGGGLGNSSTAALVNGVVYVNVGDKVADPTTQNPYQKKLKGAASFVDSNIFGCNNVKGSPQNNVFVNIYQTAHTDKDTWNYTEADATYAIDTLFGGGNHASYVPATAGCKITTTIDSCFNTINHVFGGGNAADLGVVSGTYTNVITDIRIHGGRFDYVFGGGNGYSPTGNHTHPDQPYYNPGANIYGGIDLTITGGNIGQFFGGSNQAGDVFGTPNIAAASNDNCGDLNIENFFCGGNYTDVHTDVITKFECSEGMTVKNLYGGCNLANIEGCVELTIEGGTYRNVFGGSKGLAPTPTNPDGICPEITGHVKLVLKGGSMGDVFGGCDQNGQINGDIIIEVDDAKSTQCPLHIGNIYGGGNQTAYKPTDPNATSPRVNIINGTVGGTFVVDITNTPVQFDGNVFGGGNEGKVTSNPQVTIGDKTNTSTHEANILGNVYGGGNAADVTGNTNVILQGKANIGKFNDQGELKGGGSVYGGGKLADVNGKTNVTVESNE